MLSLATETGISRLSEFGYDIVNLLLTDKTTKRNIIWASDDYISLGKEYHSKYPVTVEMITDKDGCIIQPRIFKAKYNQISRTKEKAEVFTPAWICNEQNNLVDSAWFGKEYVFNIPGYKAWGTNKAPILFREEKGARWQDYVDVRRIEITCGEAPYLTSRYDMASGNYIEVPERVGLLDRKLRVVNENASVMDEWIKWALRALQSIYGFEFQGDSLFIARGNILLTFIEHMRYRFQKLPDQKLLKKAANIISWNIWQMDGLTFTIPYGTIEEQYQQMVLEGVDIPEEKKIYCKIHDWRSKKTVYYKSLIEDKERQYGKHK